MAETFGKTTKGGTELALPFDWMYFCLFTSGMAGTLKSISLYLNFFRLMRCLSVLFMIVPLIC